jgi:hypothetical protein
MPRELSGSDASSKTSAPSARRDSASADEVEDGIGLFQTFNRFPPARVMKVRHPRVMPPVVVHLGELVGLIYRSDKGQARSPRTYIHFMEDPPRLVSNTHGTQLYLVGGSYRVSARGIEG